MWMVVWIEHGGMRIECLTGGVDRAGVGGMCGQGGVCGQGDGDWDVDECVDIGGCGQGLYKQTTRNMNSCY